jgi:hypothetical protein
MVHASRRRSFSWWALEKAVSKLVIEHRHIDPESHRCQIGCDSFQDRHSLFNGRLLPGTWDGRSIQLAFTLGLEEKLLALGSSFTGAIRGCLVNRFFRSGRKIAPQKFYTSQNI